MHNCIKFEQILLFLFQKMGWMWNLICGLHDASSPIPYSMVWKEVLNGHSFIFYINLIWDSASIGEGNRTFLIRVWIDLPIDALNKDLKGKVQNDNILQERWTPRGGLLDNSFLIKVWKPLHSLCAWAITNYIKVRHWTVCQLERWAPRGWIVQSHISRYDKIFT